MKKQLLAVMLLLSFWGCAPGMGDILGRNPNTSDPYGGSSQKDPYSRRDPYGGNTPSGNSQTRTDDLRRGRDAVSGTTPYAGNKGSYSRSFRVSVEGGTMNFGGQNIPYSPMGFQIAEGERKTIIFRSTGDKKNYLTIPVEVEYRQSILLFDSGAIRLPYESSWETQKGYSNLSSGNRSQASGISISVQGTR